MHDNIRTIEDARGNRGNRFIDDMLGSKSGFETVEDVQTAAKEQARPIYESLQGRDLALPKSVREASDIVAQ